MAFTVLLTPTEHQRLLRCAVARGLSVTAMLNETVQYVHRESRAGRWLKRPSALPIGTVNFEVKLNARSVSCVRQLADVLGMSESAVFRQSLRGMLVRYLPTYH